MTGSNVRVEEAEGEVHVVVNGSKVPVKESGFKGDYTDSETGEKVTAIGMATVTSGATPWIVFRRLRKNKLDICPQEAFLEFFSNCGEDDGTDN